MHQSFIPTFHFLPASQKLTESFANEVINYYYHNSNNKSLLFDKNVKEIEEYATGNIDMKPYMAMYKSLTSSLANVDKTMQGYKDITNGSKGIIFEPFPLITEKLNSATAIIQKIPLEIKCKATDPLAIKKKEKDILFLKNKPKIEADLQEIADSVNLGKIDIGETENSAVKYSDSPFGLDLDNPEELDIFENLLYALQIESSYETILTYFKDIKNILQIKRLEIVDQLYYAVSCHRAYQNDLTGLPDAEYVHPSLLSVPDSLLSDYSDNTHRIMDKFCTITEMYDAFAGDIGGEDDLYELINNKDTGYASSNGGSYINENNFNSAKVALKYIEVKSVDWVGIASSSKNKKGYKYLTLDENEATEKIWGQNTYCFWWLLGTKRCFGISKLGFAQRTKGQESIQNFSTNIFRSNKKGAVELAIGENKKAQRADIKLQHAVVKSLPAGRYIDMRFLRNGLTGTKEGITIESMQRVLDMAFEQNTLMGDTTDFDGKNDGQFKPVIDLPGGLRTEATGYMQIINNCDLNISRIMSANAQLTGQSANPEGLIGLQKLLINSSINGLYYATEAIGVQYQRLFTIWGSVIKKAIEEGGAVKKGIEDIIGKKKADVIDALKDGDLHEMGIFVSIGQREEERAKYQQKESQLTGLNVLSAADLFLLDSIDNPRDKYAVLAVKEQKYKKEQLAQQQAAYAQQQALAQQQGQNVVAAKTAEAQGEKDVVYAKGDVNAKIANLVSQLGINEMQLEGLVKSKLQADRNQGQVDKNIATLQEKSNLENTKPLI